MSQELITANQQQPTPFGGGRNMPSTVNAGAVAIEQERAIAEAQGQLIMAKRFPRDLTAAHAELMIACKSKAFAEVAFYSVPNRGSGPSIRFAEEVARVFGNFEFGHRELSRGDGKSEVEVYAWDKEKNNRSIRQITVVHVTDTRNGPKKLTDQADIDNKIANVASKQARGRILALMPKWLVEDAIQECRKTIAGNNDEPIEVRVRKMTQAFAKYGVKPEHLERYLGHKLDATLADEIVDLTGVFNAIKEGTPASEFFGEAEQAEQDEKTGASLAETAKAGAANNRKQTAAAKPATTTKEKAAAPAADAKAAEATNTSSSDGTTESNDSNSTQQNSSVAEENQQREKDSEPVEPVDNPQTAADIF